MPKPTRKRSAGKPTKPYPDFPLFAHAAKQWAKKIRGKLHYFGAWSNPDGALQKYLDQKDDLHAGRKPRGAREGLTLRELLNRYMSAKRARVESEELLDTTWGEYYRSCQYLGNALGMDRLVADLAADDFEPLRRDMAKRWGPIKLANEVQRVRSVFKYAYESGLIDRPVRYGPEFRAPSKKTMRKADNKRGKRLFEPHELRAVLETTPAPIEAMTMLGINCGYGNTDVATLPTTAMDLKRGWASYPRPKTGIPRRCPLWPETAAAILRYLEQRPEPKDNTHKGLLFVTPHGLSYAAGQTHWRVAGEFSKALNVADVKRIGLSFYALRHTFQTIADNVRDPVAVASIMGHAPRGDDMSAIYRERISDTRLQAVTEHVRGWLFDVDQTKPKE